MDRRRPMCSSVRSAAAGDPSSRPYEGLYELNLASPQGVIGGTSLLNPRSPPVRTQIPDKSRGLNRALAGAWAKAAEDRINIATKAMVGFLIPDQSLVVRTVSPLAFTIFDESPTGFPDFPGNIVTVTTVPGFSASSERLLLQPA